MTHIGAAAAISGKRRELRAAGEDEDTPISATSKPLDAGLRPSPRRSSRPRRRCPGRPAPCRARRRETADDGKGSSREDGGCAAGSGAQAIVGRECFVAPTGAAGRGFLQSGDEHLALHARRRAAADPEGAHRHPRRRDGHDDPALPAERGRLPRRALQGPPEEPEGQQRPAAAHAARRHRGDPRAVPRGRRRHRRDQHLRRDLGGAGRLRPRRLRARDERRRRAPGARGLRQVQQRRQAALRRRRARADAEDGEHQPRRQRPGGAQRHLRRAARRLPRAGRGPARRRLRPVPGRDDLRHAQRQGGDLRPRRADGRRAASGCR